MINYKKHTALTIATLSLLWGCASIQQGPVQPADLDYSKERELRDTFWKQTVIPVPDSFKKQPNTQIVEKDEQLYSFVANDLTVEEAAKLFGRMNNLNIVVEEGVKGTVNVDLKDLPFTDIMESILSSHGYYWERRGNIVYVRSWETRTFTVDYVRLVRKGEGSSQAKVSSSSQQGGSGEDNTAGSVYIENKDEVDFWGELETALNTMTTDKGRVITNRLAGTVQVSDVHKHVKDIATYIDHVNGSIHRQVDIEVKIVEVTLNEDNSLGVDWSRLVVDGDGNFIGGSINNIITTPAGGIPALAPTLDFNFSDINNGLNEITAILQALNEQGDVQIISQPHIRSLNNQSALIKVGTDRTFFRREQSTDSTSAGFQTTFTDVPEVVTEGIVLSITPQISSNGWITMDVSPVVTRVSSISEAFDENGNLSSSAPNLDISQVSTLVSAKNGETVVIGGLIQNQQIETVRKVPGLGHLPILGKLFSANYTSDVRTELIMLMTPRLINP